jgi:hypothetical protein
MDSTENTVSNNVFDCCVPTPCFGNMFTETLPHNGLCNHITVLHLTLVRSKFEYNSVVRNSVKPPDCNRLHPAGACSPAIAPPPPSLLQLRQYILEKLNCTPCIRGVSP